MTDAEKIRVIRALRHRLRAFESPRKEPIADWATPLRLECLGLGEEQRVVATIGDDTSSDLGSRTTSASEALDRLLAVLRDQLDGLRDAVDADRIIDDTLGKDR